MKENIVVVASTTNIVVATMWREHLRAEGIAAELGGTNMSTSVYAMMPQLAGIDVLVREEDAVRARGLIDQAEHNADAAERTDPAGAPRRLRTGLRGDAMRFVPVTTVADAGLANVIRGVLEQAGIAAAIGGTGMEDVYPTPFVNPLQILVEAADEERARDVLAQYETLPQEADEEE